jgi:hypothetical protein
MYNARQQAICPEDGDCKFFKHSNIETQVSTSHRVILRTWRKIGRSPEVFDANINPFQISFPPNEDSGKDDPYRIFKTSI